MNKIYTNLTIVFVEREGKPKIVIDRKCLFDKVWKCPIIVDMPKNLKQLQELNDKIDWLQTKEGYEASKKYKFELFMRGYKNETI